MGFAIWLANEKGRGRGNWLVLAALFGPVALIALAGAPAIAVPDAEPLATVPDPPADASPWRPDHGPPPARS